MADLHISRVYPLPKPTPPGPMDDPIRQQGDVSVADVIIPDQGSGNPGGNGLPETNRPRFKKES
jgi:hypothetical protein